MISTMTTRNLGRKRFIWLAIHSPSWQLGEELEAETEAEAREECCYLAYSACFLITARATCPRMSLSLCAGPSHIDHQSGMCPTELLTGWSRAFPMTLDCVVKKTNSEGFIWTHSSRGIRFSHHHGREVWLQAGMLAEGGSWNLKSILLHQSLCLYLYYNAVFVIMNL